MKRFVAVSVLALVPVLARADQVLLKSGGQINGEIVEQRADAIVMEVGPGRITLPIANVVRVVSSTTDLGLYRARAAALAPRDVAGWLDLAAWAQAHGLATQAREAYLMVLAADPQNATAHLALGDVRVDGQWLSGADANRARGLVEYEGTWMTPQERQARMMEDAAAAAEMTARREADARAREAEARAREAEARAQSAEADGQGGQGSGIPYPWIFGPTYGPVIGAGYGLGYGGGFAPHPHPHHLRTGPGTGFGLSIPSQAVIVRPDAPPPAPSPLKNPTAAPAPLGPRHNDR